MQFGNWMLKEPLATKIKKKQIEHRNSKENNKSEFKEPLRSKIKGHLEITIQRNPHTWKVEGTLKFEKESIILNRNVNKHSKSNSKGNKQMESWGNHGQFRNLGEPVGLEIDEPIGAPDIAPPLRSWVRTLSSYA